MDRERGAIRAAALRRTAASPQNALTGQQFEVNSGTADITVPYQYSKLRVWRNTAVANLQPGQTLTLAPGSGTLGYEWDEDVDNGFRPAGRVRPLLHHRQRRAERSNDYGSEPGDLTDEHPSATHHLTLYRAPSGALVFGAGTVQWSWGLENVNAWDEQPTEPSHNPPDPNMEQFTVNLLPKWAPSRDRCSQGSMPATPVDRHHPADLDDHLAGAGGNAPGRQPGDDHRYRHRRRRRSGRRGRSLHRQRRDVASRDAHNAGRTVSQLVLHVGGARVTPRRRSNRARSTTAPTWRHPRPGSRSTCPARARSGAAPSRRPSPTRGTRTRSSSASSSPRKCSAP